MNGVKKLIKKIVLRRGTRQKFQEFLFPSSADCQASPKKLQNKIDGEGGMWMKFQ